MTKTNEHSYKELLDDLGYALINRGKFDAELAELEREKVALKKMARRAKWFSEKRYKAWANYFTCMADIVHMKRIISNNNRRIAELEDSIAYFGIPTSDEYEAESDPNFITLEEADFENSPK